MQACVGTATPAKLYRNFPGFVSNREVKYDATPGGYDHTVRPWYSTAIAEARTAANGVKSDTEYIGDLLKPVHATKPCLTGY